MSFYDSGSDFSYMIARNFLGTFSVLLNDCACLAFWSHGDTLPKKAGFKNHLFEGLQH